MTTIKVSQLPTATDIVDPILDWVMIVQGGGNKKISPDTIFKNIMSDVIVNPALTSVDVTINGHGLANLLKVDGTNNYVGVGVVPTERFHVVGNVKVDGNVKVSQEIITVPSTTGALAINSSYEVSVIQTTTSSVSTQVISLPTGVNNQFKTVTYADGAANRRTGVIYTLQDNLIGASQIVFTKVGTSVTLYGYGGKWVIINYSGNGVTIV